MGNPDRAIVIVFACLVMATSGVRFITAQSQSAAAGGSGSGTGTTGPGAAQKQTAKDASVSRWTAGEKNFGGSEQSLWGVTKSSGLSEAQTWNAGAGNFDYAIQPDGIWRSRQPSAGTENATGTATSTGSLNTSPLNTPGNANVFATGHSVTGASTVGLFSSPITSTTSYGGSLTQTSTGHVSLGGPSGASLGMSSRRRTSHEMGQQTSRSNGLGHSRLASTGGSHHGTRRQQNEPQAESDSGGLSLKTGRRGPTNGLAGKESGNGARAGHGGQPQSGKSRGGRSESGLANGLNGTQSTGIHK
jgi:hypothetical protein